MAGSPLLDSVIDAHGGAAAWQSVTALRAHIRSGGFLPRTRMPGTKLADYTVTIDPRRPYAILDPFPKPGSRGVFDDDSVRIEAADGELTAERRDPRSVFFGVSGMRRNVRWDALDSVYFAGYAMWNYLTTPWLLAAGDVEVSETGEPGRHGYRRLDARFPARIPTHCERQSFFVDPDGLIRRHDYTAEVIGGWASAAHLCSHHLASSGLIFPTRRRVRPQGPQGRALPGPTLVSLDIDSIEIERGP